MLKVTLIAVGNKLPSWVNDGVLEYVKRLREVQFQLVELPLLKRGKTSNLQALRAKETQMIATSIPPDAFIIALDVQGVMFSSEQLALKLAQLQQHTSHICCIIGGPEGLDKELLDKAQERWSLSKLTLPHSIARLVLVEALYRSFSILVNHPYHK